MSLASNSQRPSSPDILPDSPGSPAFLDSDAHSHPFTDHSVDNYQSDDNLPNQSQSNQLVDNEESVDTVNSESTSQGVTASTVLAADDDDTREFDLPRSVLTEPSSSSPEPREPESSRASASAAAAGASRGRRRSALSGGEDSSSTLTETRDPTEPPSKKQRIETPKSPKHQEETDGETCPICLDIWGNSGEHRLVSLKCGHLFGESCVLRWLKAQPIKNRSCPTCKSKAHLKDLRHIYARRLVAADNSQITALQKQIDFIQVEKCKTELALENTKLSLRACSMQLDVLRSLMKSQANKVQPIRKSWRFALEKNLEICKDGGCRVLTYNYRTYELYVSQKSTNYLFPGYGIRKVSCLDYKLGQFVHLHPKPIRDITYSQPRDLLLSVGLDSSARIVERGIPSVTITTTMPLWSCSWDYLRSNEFFVGGVGGVIQQYDVRNPSTFVQTLTAPGDLSPVVSLRSTEFGLLSCQLNSCWLWVGSNRPWEPRALPIEGSFTSLCYDKDSQRALVATRPNGLERSKLTVCKLKASILNGEVLFDVEEAFNGSARSNLMSRPCWVKVPGASWVAAHSESDSALFLHGLDGSRTMSLPAAEPALDVNAVELNGNNILASLSESRLRIYKAVPT